MLQKLETEKIPVCHLILQHFLQRQGRFSPGTETDTELHHTRGKSGLGGIPGDVCFREISLFPLSDGPEPGLWESLSPMSFCWPPLQKDMA